MADPVLILTPTDDVSSGVAPATIQQTFVLTTDKKVNINAITIASDYFTIESGYEPGGANVPFVLNVSPDYQNIILNVDAENFDIEKVQSAIVITAGTVANTFDIDGRVTKSYDLDMASKIMSQDKV